VEPGISHRQAGGAGEQEGGLHGYCGRVKSFIVAASVTHAGNLSDLTLT
jgi:hypothetical protein